MLFFALSGFVLSLPFPRARPWPGYADFAIKRICPPFTIPVPAALYALMQPAPVPGMSRWFNKVL